jgi:predicted NUDIX family NTP pyrophosphohydrolase
LQFVRIASEQLLPNPMATKYSAGILLYRRVDGDLQVFLVHPGGPFWAKRDDHAWSIPKGEYPSGADALEAARREFSEETGQSISGAFIALNPVKQPGGKLISIWVVEGNLEPATLRSNTFWIEWPPKSGEQREFPEVDRAEWFNLALARRKILPGQLPFLAELEAIQGEREN